MFKYKIILAGAKRVGKSSLIARFCDNVFNENMMDTIGVAFKRKKIDFGESISLELNIWDFAGEEQFRNLFNSYCNGASAALILYDTTRKETISDVENWVQIFDQNALDGASKILIGTKIDLKDLRQMSKVEAEKLSKRLNFDLGYIETSSKTGVNVEAAFSLVAKKIIQNSFQKCKKCGELFSKKLKFCNYCGQKAEGEVLKIFA